MTNDSSLKGNQCSSSTNVLLNGQHHIFFVVQQSRGTSSTTTPAVLCHQLVREIYCSRSSNLSFHTVNLFAGCLDQVGLLEMRSLLNLTNGVVVLSDFFTTSIFKQSFLRVFNKDDQGHLSMGFNTTFDIQVSFFFALIMHIFGN